MFTGDVERDGHRSPRRTAPRLLCPALPSPLHRGAACEAHKMSTRTPLPTVNERDTENVSAVIQRRRCDTGCGERNNNDRGSGFFLRTDRCRFMTEAGKLQHDAPGGHFEWGSFAARDPEII